MASVVTGSKIGVRNVRKLERPRPLKPSSGETIPEKPTVPSPTLENVTSRKSLVPEDIIKELADLNMTITNGNYDKNTNAAVIKLCSQLKYWGQQLEDKYKDSLDRYFETLRNASRSEKLGLHARTHLLEVIELRAKAWKIDQTFDLYYKQKLSDISNMQNTNYYGAPSLMTSATLPANFNPGQANIVSPTHILTHSNSQATLSPGEVLKNSGKFPHPTKIPGKNFMKDEVVIRNSDSGKVGPGTRDRLVQIMGADTGNIDHAKLLIEETIRRNASPIREMPEMGVPGLVASDSSTSLNSTASEESLGSSRLQHSNSQLIMYPGNITGPITQTTDLSVGNTEFKKKGLVHSHSLSDSTLGEFLATVNVGGNVLKISGVNPDLVKKAKLVLEEYFAGEAEVDRKQREHESSLAATIIQASNKLPTTKYPSNSYVVSPEICSQSNGNYSWGVATKRDSNGSNGSGSNYLPTTSSSEEDATVKAGESSPDEENMKKVSHPAELKRTTSFLGSKFNFQKSQNLTGGQIQNGATVTVLRQPIFPSSKPEALLQTEKFTDQATLTANNRRANFSQKNLSSESSSSTSSKEDVPSQDKQLRNRSKSSPELEYSMGVPKQSDGTRICYTRQFLLNCAKNPLCKLFPTQPKSFVEQAQAILRQDPIKYFDPTTYSAPGPSSAPRWKPSISPPKSESFDSGL